MYELDLAPSARRGLYRLPDPVIHAVGELITGPLLDNPHRLGKPLLVPLDGLHVARRGQYRVVYQIDEDAKTVRVLRIAHRRDVYRV